MSFGSPWWVGSYQVNGEGVAVASPRWIPEFIVDGLDGRVILSRWWGLEWWAPEMPASEHNALLVLTGSAVSVVTPDQASPTTFTLYPSAILTGITSEGQLAKVVKEVKVSFRVYV